MTLSLDRGLALLERLCGQPEGMRLTGLADELDIPRSACHRLLVELQRRGYVRQVREQGDYVLTAKLASLGLSFLSSTGIVDIAEPVLERLAQDSGELVRLSLVDGDRLTWVAKAQGARDAAVEQLSRLVALDTNYEDAAMLLEAARAEQERAAQAHRKRAGSAEPQPRILSLSNAHRRVAVYGSRARRMCRAHAAVHAQSGARGEDAHLLARQQQ